MKRRIISIITALALCLSLCPTWAFAAEPDPALCPHHWEHTGADTAAFEPEPSDTTEAKIFFMFSEVSFETTFSSSL